MSDKKLTLRYISPKTYSAVVATTNGHFYASHFPYTRLVSSEKIDKRPISKSFLESDMHSTLFPRVMLQAMSEMNDLFIKINNGSIDILDDAHYKELMLEKIKNNIFLLEGEGRSTIFQWLSLSFLFIQYSKDDVSDILNEIEDAGYNGDFIAPIYKRFGRYKKDSLINKLLDKEVDKMRNEGKWKALRQATFTLCFMTKCYAKSRYSESKKVYEDAIEEFERNTGIDANYSNLQRHTDRFTRNQHFNGKRKKKRSLSN